PMADAMVQEKRGTKDLSEAWTGLWETLTMKVSPALTAVARNLTEVISGNTVAPIEREIKAVETGIEHLKVQIGNDGWFAKWIDTRTLEAAEAHLEELKKRVQIIKKKDTQTVEAPEQKKDEEKKPQFPALEPADKGDTELARFRTQLAQMQADF